MKYLAFASLLMIALAAAPIQKNKYEYAPAKISHHNGQLHFQATGKYKPMPDTIIDGYIIRRVR